ncbi:MAG: pantoate--beta-alanine ligase [Caldisericaceae bacterium]|nr:pantoate--beta-alanine ligase [Caldisericaceae bacterium]
MEIIRTVEGMKEFSQKIKESGKPIGFVPTMGYLHEGHLSLVRKAKEENDTVVTSIFVNPTQFAPTEDLDQYPRDEKGDSAKLKKEGVAAIFIPTIKEIYPTEYQTYVEVTELTKNLCGRSRPTHFRGVTTIVLKLFKIVNPDRAYFGKKDYQQFRVIEKMCRDLNFDVKIVSCPIVREKDGIAMSSRNKYLTEKERRDAIILYQALEKGKEIILNGERNSNKIIQEMTNMIRSKKTLKKIDYVSIVDLHTLKNLHYVDRNILIAVAAYFGKVRLIDNIEVIIDAKNNA